MQLGSLGAAGAALLLLQKETLDESDLRDLAGANVSEPPTIDRHEQSAQTQTA